MDFIRIVSDLISFTGYLALGTIFLVFVMKRGSSPYRSAFRVFVCFLYVRSLFYAVDLVNVLHPWHGSESGLRIMSAFLTMVVVGYFAALLPYALNWKDPRELQLQIQRSQSEKMYAVGQLAAGVAHEINNPLGVILGFAQCLVRDTPASDPRLPGMRSIEREALRCRDLVRNLLSFARDRKPGFAAENPVDVLQGALSLVEAEVKMKKIELRREMGRDLPSLQMDGNQIQQVVINLCNNAIDAMPFGGTLDVAAAMKDGRLEIRVSDTGMGIPSDIMERIYEPFFTTKEVGKGTGLGLSLAFDIIKKHHGCIQCQSEVGKGTTFTVRIPGVQAGAAAEKAAA